MCIYLVYHIYIYIYIHVPGTTTVFFGVIFIYPSPPGSLFFCIVLPFVFLRAQALASSLTYLDARENRIAGPTGAHAPQLAALGRLKNLVLASRGRRGGGHPNPVCTWEEYRRDIFAVVRSLQTLDGDDADGGRETAAAATGLDARATATATDTAMLARSTCALAAERDGVRARRRRRSRDGSKSRSSSQSRKEGVVVGAMDGVRNSTPAASHGTAHDIQRAGKRTAATAAGTAPEELLPRFEVLAGRFRRRHSRGREERGQTLRRGSGRGERGGAGGGRRHGREEDNDDDGSEGSSGTMSSRPSSISDGRSSRSDGGACSEEEGDFEQESQEGYSDGYYVVAQSEGGTAARKHHPYPEETTARTVAVARRRRKRPAKGDSESVVSSVDGAAVSSGLGAESVPPLRGEDAAAEDATAEENGLLSRLRSIAQEARLEVMDSRLQDLHVSCVRSRYVGVMNNGTEIL